MKRFIYGLAVIALAISLTACAKAEEYTDVEKFAARANYTISLNVLNFLPDAEDYTFTTLEYYEELSSRIIRADCGFKLNSGSIVRDVFVLSDNEDYLKTLGAREYLNIYYTVSYEDFTELYYINLGDGYEFEVKEDDLVDRQRVTELTKLYIKTEDKSYLGM